MVIRSNKLQTPSTHSDAFFFKGTSPLLVYLLRWFAALDKYAMESPGNRNTGESLEFLDRFTLAGIRRIGAPN